MQSLAWSSVLSPEPPTKRQESCAGSIPAASIVMNWGKKKPHLKRAFAFDALQLDQPSCRSAQPSFQIFVI